jgi:hypothetical protein
MKNIIAIVSTLLPYGPMDALGVGVLNFHQKTYQAFEAHLVDGEVHFPSELKTYFDLASVTKPLTNSLTYFLRSEAFSQDMLLCLNHRAGLPSWGLLGKDSWREQILSYKIIESETLYSDFSALRVMLELEKKSLNQKSICQTVWDKETLFWTDLLPHYQVPQYGYIKSLPNYGSVHDPNALVIEDFCSHAGLFSTINGLCSTLLNYHEKTDFIKKVKEDLSNHSRRFSYGWDRVMNPLDTLAGQGCGKYTFGHLGFTGASLWIDPDKMLGHVILTNATKHHWFDKSNLNDIRRAIGEQVWQNLA